MNFLAAICIRRPVFASVLTLAMLVFGVFGYLSLGLDRFPKVDIPIITVTTRLPGSASEDVETTITDKIEQAVNTISGIDELRSVSSEGISQVFVSFLLEKDIDIAAQDVRDKVNRILADLPKGIEQPTIEKLDPDATPVLVVAVSADVPLRDLTEYCDKVLRRQLESIKDVGQATLVGGQARQVNVHLDPLKLRSHKLTVADVAGALAAQNLQSPGGSVKHGSSEFTLRTLGRVERVDEFSLITVANHNGHTITVGDLGWVEDGAEEMESSARYNDTPAVLLNVRKQSGTNTVEVANRVKERLQEILKLTPKGYHIDIVRDQSTFIEASVDTVKEHLTLGSLFAAVVIYFFLANVRTTIIAALAIPTSIISAFAVIQFMGFTLNSITLLALALSVGIVIDDAIVVLENIFRYIEEKDCTPFEAAFAATKEIGLAVLSITLSLVAVFTPIAFMGGIVGRFLKSFGITMSATILVSMIISFSLTPMLAARWLRRPKEKGAPGERGDGSRPAHSSGSKSRSLYHWIEAGYMVLLRVALRFRFVTALGVVLLLCSIPVLLGMVRKNFLPDDDQSEFEINVRAPEGTSLEATQLIVDRIAREVRSLNGIRYTVASAADSDQRIANEGKIYVRMVDLAQRTFDQFETMEYVRKSILPPYRREDLRISVTPVAVISGGGMSSSDIQFMISGPNMQKLDQYAQHVMADLRQIKGATDVDSSLVVGKPQFGVNVDRAKAADLGVSVADIANTQRLLVAGDKVTDYNEKGEQYEVHVRATPRFRNRLDELATVSVPSSKYGIVSLGDVVEFRKGTGPAQINRLNRTREVTISANLAPNTSEQGVLDAIQASVNRLDMGLDYRSGLLGRSKELAKTMRSFLLIFIMAFLFAYLVIAAQFESWLHPITILLSLPLTLPFALVSLMIFNQSLNIFSLLGILVLFAVVKKNSILQIDHTNQLRESGMSRHEAILAANRDRLRPILMTTVAFVAGMIPLLVSNSEGASVNKAISGVVIGGQTLSLLLTLVATPVAYSFFDDLARLPRWFRGRRRSDQPTDGDAVCDADAQPLPEPEDDARLKNAAAPLGREEPEIVTSD